MWTTLISLAPTSAVFLLRRWQQGRGSAADANDLRRHAVARDAAAVRALADRCRGTNPGFASDLDAAAARSECALQAPDAGSGR